MKLNLICHLKSGFGNGLYGFISKRHGLTKNMIFHWITKRILNLSMTRSLHGIYFIAFHSLSDLSHTNTIKRKSKVKPTS